MVGSRKLIRPNDVHDRTLTVVEQFERALGEILARVRVSSAFQEPVRAIGIAYSGGLDSSVLLHLLCDYVAGSSVRLFAFHVHHGISPNADHWMAHCERESMRLGVNFDARRVQLGNCAQSGVEEAARLARYAALGELCRARGVPLLLTAHHVDDQAETVLLQLLRGSGVAGLSGMDTINAAPDLLGDGGHLIGRPLLAVTRAELEWLAAKRQISYIHDESNADTRYTRNTLRHHLMPVLAQHFPGFQERFARSAQHARSAQALLNELAASDFERCADGECLDTAQMQVLSRERVNNLLRYWFRWRGLRMPSTAWLDELRTQLLDAESDAQVCVTYPGHPDCQVRRYRNRLMVVPQADLDAELVSQVFCWDGETRICFPGFGGSLHFDHVDPTAEGGVDAQWLRRRLLQLRYRRGGERLKLAIDRPTRTLKQHYQSLGIPVWERERLPLVFAGDKLLYAAGIGVNCHLLSADVAPKICLRWSTDVG